MSCLETIANVSTADWNRESKSDAQSLLLSMLHFSFIVALVATHRVLAYTKGLSVKLQGPYVDVARAHREIETVKATLQGVRSNVESFHEHIYTRASQIAQSVDTEESTSRLASRQQHRRNIAAPNCTEYYRLNLTIPLVDHLLTELNSRFDTASSKNIVEFIHLLPPSAITTPRSDRQSIESILQLYEDNLPCSLSFDSELDLWQHKWASEPQLACELNTPEKCLVHTDSDLLSQHSYPVANYGNPPCH